jgi:CheY-like chemotaxis protein
MYTSDPKTTTLPLILLVEDDEALLENLEEALSYGHFRVVPATNARSALDILTTLSPLPELIISDIVMPGMDGYQFLKAVRANPQWKHIPFLFISDQEATGLVVDPEFVVIGYLYKPFGVPQLLDMAGRLRSRAG